mmetsp:Transcript_78549/g.156142  ORF Transcript_78549/g.156142 Transcript_78549/m.156142 type:complete len:157 (-) Transcript_78549:1123-1593(-)
MRTLRYRGLRALLPGVFRIIDEDGGGTIGFDELFEFVRGVRHPFDRRHARARSLSLELPEGVGGTLEDVAWDVETLQWLLQLMMARAGAFAMKDLIKLWDKNADHQVSSSCTPLALTLLRQTRPHASLDVSCSRPADPAHRTLPTRLTSPVVISSI